MTELVCPICQREKIPNQRPRIFGKLCEYHKKKWHSIWYMIGGALYAYIFWIATPALVIFFQISSLRLN